MVAAVELFYCRRSRVADAVSNLFVKIVVVEDEPPAAAPAPPPQSAAIAAMQ